MKACQFNMCEKIDNLALNMFSPYYLTRPTKKVICIEYNRIRIIFLLVVEAKSFLLKKIVNFFFMYATLLVVYWCCVLHFSHYLNLW